MISGSKDMAMKNFLFFILITDVYVCMVVGSTRANTSHVGKQYAHSSIMQAIAKAKNGDTILVHGGLYQEENILITKSLSLIGIDNPVIDAQKKHEPVSIEANHVTIKGFTIKNYGHSSKIG